MPVYPVSTPTLSFQENNPMLSGIQAGMGFGSDALRQQLMATQAQQAQIQNQYLPQMDQADIGLKQAQTQTMPWQAMGQYLRGYGSAAAQSPTMQFVKTLSTLPQPVRDSYFINNPQIKGVYDAAMNNALNSVGAPGQSSQFPNLSGPPQMSGTNGMGPRLPPITTTNAPVQTTNPNAVLPTPGLGNTINAVNQAGMGNNLTINPNALQQGAQMDLLKTTSIPWKSLPETQRNAQIAQATGMGYDAQTAAGLFSQGYSLPQLALQKGLGADPSKWPAAQYAPTSQTIAQNQQRVSKGAELDSLGNFITQGLTPYSGHVIAGYSPALIKDLATNQNDPSTQLKIANFIAANAAGLDESNLRAVLSGNPRPGIEVGNHLLESGLQKMKIPRSMISSDTFQMSQNILNQQIQAAASKGTSVANQTGAQLQAPSTGLQQDGSLTINVSGKPKSYTSAQVQSTAQKYGMNPQQLAQYISAKGGV